MAAFVQPLILFQSRPLPLKPPKTPLNHRRKLQLCLETSSSPTSVPPPSVFSPSTSALLQAIRAVAVGKFGSKPIPSDLFDPLRDELSLAAASLPTYSNLDLHLLRASFLGSLYVKSQLSDDERDLLSWATSADTMASPDQVLATIDAGSAAHGSDLASFARRVLAGERLSTQQAKQLGDLLYAPDDMKQVGVRPIKALIAHVMRVRHESAEELSGLALAACASLKETWLDGTTGANRYALLAEPFDGVVTHDLLTPLIAKHLQQHGFKAVMNVGRSSGPKYGPNLRDLVLELGVPFCRSGKEVETVDGEFGVAVDQADSSPGLSCWVHMRRVILKRPGIATVEKYIDGCPGGAKLFVASAFHTSYIEKMAVAAEVVGFEAYIIVGKGMEGSLGLGVGEKRTATLLTGWKEGGLWRREEVKYNIHSEGIKVVDVEDPEKGGADVKSMGERIRNLSQGDEEGLFHMRVKATLGAFDKALTLLKEKKPQLFS